MSKELVSQNDIPILSEPTGIVPTDGSSGKVLQLSAHSGHSRDYGRILAAAVQMLNAADVVTRVQKGIEYVVQVPAKYQAALQKGTVEMMHGAGSGKTWATLVRKLANGKQEIVCNCPIEKQIRTQGNPVQSMAATYQNLYMQQKLSEISEQVQEVFEVVRRIEQGQMDDRIGTLMSGRDDILRATKNPDRESMTREIELARSKISEGHNQIGQVFKSRIESFEPIPENRLGRFLREVVSLKTQYMSKRDEEFRRLQEYFELYLRATQLLAWSYSIVGDYERASCVFEQSTAFLQTIDFSKVRTLDHIYPKHTMDDAFYHQAVPYIQEERTVCLEEAKPYDFIQITVTGEKLKEVFENGETV